MKERLPSNHTCTNLTAKSRTDAIGCTMIVRAWVVLSLFVVEKGMAFSSHTLVHGSTRRMSDAFWRRYSTPDNKNLDKGFNLLELAGAVVPQGRIVGTAKETVKFAWKRMMAELAPQDKKDGSYQRQSYAFSTTTDLENEPGKT